MDLNIKLQPLSVIFEHGALSFGAYERYTLCVALLGDIQRGILNDVHDVQIWIDGYLESIALNYPEIFKG